MIIINSAAYVISEFQSEFGRIPPSMLPLGNKKLIEHQVESLISSFPDEKIVLSLPASFEDSMMDFGDELSSKIQVIFVPDFFTLSESVLYILNVQESNESSVRILHGDTLFSGYPAEKDIISVSDSVGEYSWELDSEDGVNKLVWSGFFSFSSRSMLIKSLALSKSSFVDAVKYYKANIGMDSVVVKEWYDLGHINTYFKSRSTITTQRSFNSLVVNDGVVVKKGNPEIKILSEGQWFERLPSKLRKYIPQFIESGVDETGFPFYSIEYLTISPLNEVFVHGKNSIDYWNMIFRLSGKLFSDFRNFSNVDADELRSEVQSLYCDKTHRRITEYMSQVSGGGHTPQYYDSIEFPSLNKIISDCIDKTLALPIVPCVLHGDFCFSNVLFDSRSSALKVIDPRALNESNEFTLEGDQKYDLAKLSHSVIGLYDLIISGRYKIKNIGTKDVSLEFYDSDRLEEIQETFLKTEFIPGISTRDIMPLTALLFFSMLPLHSDRPDRQKAMLLNAIRLYKTYVYEPVRKYEKDFL